MLSYNTLYGQPAALMRRRIWSGEDRKLPSISVRQENAFRPHNGFLPTKTEPPSLCVWNGRIYAVAYGTELYTTPDFKTMTLRLSGVNIASLAQRDGTILVGVMSHPNYGMFISTNDGASFSGVSQSAFAVSSAGEYFFSAYSYSGGSSLFRSATGVSAWSSVTNPHNGVLLSRVLYNGSVYMALGNLSVSNTPAACWSDTGVAFLASDGWSAAVATIPTDGRPRQAVVVGNTFVMIGAYGPRVICLRSTDGRSFEVQQHLLATSEGEDFGTVSHACVIDGIIYARATTTDALGGKRIRLMLSTDAGLSWRLLSGLAEPRSGTSSVGAAVTGALFPLASGQGLYYAPGQGSVYGLVSDTVNDRDFYYELGAQ